MEQPKQYEIQDLINAGFIQVKCECEGCTLNPSPPVFTKNGKTYYYIAERKTLLSYHLLIPKNLSG